MIFWRRIMANKFDEGKIRTDLIAPEWLEEIAKTLTLGAVNYGDGNWQGVEPNRFIAALMRHEIEIKKGKVINIEIDINGKKHILNHYAQIAVNALFLMSLEMKRNV